VVKIAMKLDFSRALSIKNQCNASIGVVVFIDREGSQEDFLRWVDAAMYQAKGAGGNFIRFYAAKA